MREQETIARASWREVDPWLNDGLCALASRDREALLLRYFDGLSTPDVAVALGITESNARKRLSRAIDRLRTDLRQHDVAVSGAALAALLNEHSARAIPPHLSFTSIEALRNRSADPGASTSGSPSPPWRPGPRWLMAAGKHAIVALTAGTVLIASALVVPIVVRMHRHVSSRPPAGRFTDSATSSPESSATHQEIAASLQQLIDGYNQRDLRQWTRAMAPTAVAIARNGRAFTAAQVIASNERDLATHPDSTLHGALKSLVIRGDQAVAMSEWIISRPTEVGDCRAVISFPRTRWMRCTGETSEAVG